jgi:hypothetical protein
MNDRITVTEILRFREKLLKLVEFCYSLSFVFIHLILVKEAQLQKLPAKTWIGGVSKTSVWGLVEWLKWCNTCLVNERS